MQYKIERAKIGGLKQPCLYLTGWVHGDSFVITAKENQQVLTRFRGFVNRPDIAKKYHESTTRANQYGFYKEIPLSNTCKKVTLILEQKNKQNIILQKNNTWLCRLIVTLGQATKAFLRKINRAIRSKLYLVKMLRLPRGLFDKKMRKMMHALYPGCTIDPLLLDWVQEDYQKWLRKYYKCGSKVSLLHKPKISIIMPVYNPPEKLLEECIQSVLNQTYENFEICIADDCSTDPTIKKTLQKFQKQDRRIKIVFCKKNGGISAASNAALKIATGEFVALLDNDDTLAPEALYENIKVLNKYHQKLDFLYSDEDKIDLLGQPCDPHFKPDWAPDTLMSYNYITHLAVIRKKLIEQVGGFRSKYDGAQDHDLFLRITEQITADRIYHIPKILYHWRMSETSTSSTAGNKSYATKAGKNVLQDTLKRRDIKGKVETYTGTFYRVYYTPDAKNKVSIIIPTKDNYQMLRRCVASIHKNTTNKYEIIIVSNNTKDPDALKYLQKLKKQKDITILTINKPFNFSLLNNEATKIARGQYLLFLNDDTKVITKDWLKTMVGYAEQNHIGAVGAKLIYENNITQHVGVAIGLGYNDGPGHIFAGLSKDDFGALCSLQVPYNYSAVTGACLMVSKEKFQEVGCFDEELPVNYNDVDLCLALQNKGYYNVCLNQVVLYHYESVTRNIQNYRAIYDLTYALERIHDKWGMEIFKHDPFYNINYSRISPYALKTNQER